MTSNIIKLMMRLVVFYVIDLHTLSTGLIPLVLCATITCCNGTHMIRSDIMLKPFNTVANIDNTKSKKRCVVHIILGSRLI